MNEGSAKRGSQRYGPTPGERALDACVFPILGILIATVFIDRFPSMERYLMSWREWVGGAVGLLYAALLLRAVRSLSAAWSDPSARILRFSASVLLIPLALIVFSLLRPPLETLAALWAHPISTAEGEWSKPDHGLRARLLVSPATKENPFCRIYIELGNVGDTAESMMIQFEKGRLALEVKDESGKPLPVIGRGGDEEGFVRLGPLALPFDGTLRFRVSHQGVAYSPGKDRVIIDMGRFDEAWSIPQDGLAYYLSGTLTIAPKKDVDEPSDWRGTLELPKVRIPATP
jgi:hypothetical protein